MLENRHPPDSTADDVHIGMTAKQLGNKSVARNLPSGEAGETCDNGPSTGSGAMPIPGAAYTHAPRNVMGRCEGYLPHRRSVGGLHDTDLVWGEGLDKRVGWLLCWIRF